MPARLVQDQHRVHARRQLPGKVLQKHLHCACIRSRQGQGEDIISSRPAGGKQGQALVALIDYARRAHPTLIPDPCRPALLAKARFVLAPELNTCPRVLSRDGLQLGRELLF